MRWSGSWYIPALFTAVIGTLLIISIPLDFDKYRLTHLRTFENQVRESYAFADVNGDGNDELIDCGGINTNGLRNNDCGIRLFSGDALKTIDQLNVEELVMGSGQWIASDHDQDGYEEVGILGVEGNDLYMHLFEMPDLNTPILKIRVDSLARHQGRPEAAIAKSHERDINGDGYREVYFRIGVGFPIYPRRSYCLDIYNRELIAGPISSAGFNVMGQFSYDSPYLTGATVSSGNHEDTIDLPYPDLNAYTFALDDKLNFLFEPLKCDEYPQNCPKAILGNYLFILKREDGGSIVEKRKVVDGELDTSYDLGASYMQLTLIDNQLLLSRSGELRFIDENLKTVRIITHPKLADRGDFFDLQGDGQPEYFTKPLVNSTGYIFSEDFDHPVPLSLKGSQRLFGLEVRTVGKRGRELVVRKDTELEFYRYDYNASFWLRWPYYLLVFFFSGLVSSLLFKRFRQNIEKRYRQERQLSRLQLLAIKNQVDPHFTLNALNSIDWMYRNNETQKASSFMGKLSRMMRQTVVNSDRISCSLYEELDFCRNYCQLEKLRDDSFQFHIEVDEALDPFEIEIPRQLVFTYVENAIKHGLRPKEGEKNLWIKVQLLPHGIEIRVVDDGVGFKKEAATSGTGKGLQIVEEMVALWEKLRGTQLQVKTSRYKEFTQVQIDLLEGNY